MALIRPEDAKSIYDDFRASLTGEVDLVAFVDIGEENSEKTLSIISELGRLSNKIYTKVYNMDKDLDAVRIYQVTEAPTTIVAPHDKKSGRIKFRGMPSGYEFNSLIEIIKNVSRNEVPVTASVLHKISGVSKPVNIKVYVTPSCPYCPRIVQAAHRFSLINENISSEMVEILEFEKEAGAAGVKSVPHVSLNGVVEFVGAFPDEKFAAYVVDA